MFHVLALGPPLFQLYSLGDLCQHKNFKAHLYAHFPQSMSPALAVQLDIISWHLLAITGYIKSASQLLMHLQNSRYYP